MFYVLILCWEGARLDQDSVQPGKRGAKRKNTRSAVRGLALYDYNLTEIANGCYGF